MIVAVTGLAREARIVGGPGIVTIVGGGDALQRRLTCDLPKQARRILSIGICGALSPKLRVGDVILASDVVTPSQSISTDEGWTNALAERLPNVVVAPIAGIDTIAPDSQTKAILRNATHAAAVDMESHIAARAAQLHGLPFAALRVVSDAAHRSLPPAACVPLLPDGRVDVSAVMWSLLGAPWQIPALIRTAWEAERAFAALLRCRRVLGGFGVVDFGQLALDMG
jgi:adenosylhomocysteine nucleosidase